MNHSRTFTHATQCHRMSPDFHLNRRRFVDQVGRCNRHGSLLGGKFSIRELAHQLRNRGEHLVDLNPLADHSCRLEQNAHCRNTKLLGQRVCRANSVLPACGTCGSICLACIDQNGGHVFLGFLQSIFAVGNWRCAHEVLSEDSRSHSPVRTVHKCQVRASARGTQACTNSSSLESFRICNSPIWIDVPLSLGNEIRRLGYHASVARGALYARELSSSPVLLSRKT
mmetsp:Transcript_4001/g.6875  ORF Transcript_4001/g.6875 Transcript_4001/m.6875 type:complete len:226 (-) Transcript_4001:103-780(-)